VEHVIGFVGYECEDIVLYLAKLLTYLGKKAIIVDRTEQEMLLEVLEIPTGTVREADISGVTVTTRGLGGESYDVIFYLFGYRLIHPKLYECSSLIMVTDGVPAHASLLRKIGHWDRKQHLIIRNLVPMKHTEQYLASLAEHGENYSELPFDEKDFRMKYSLGAYADCKIRQLSKGMKDTLVTLVEFISPDIPERLVREAIRKT